MSKLIDFAKKEFENLGWPGDDEMQAAICGDILELIKVFSEQGHSSTTAPYVISRFKKLAMFEPISPLTGADDEWCEVTDGVFQNKRCSHVFKKNGQAYDIDGKIFREKNGSCYTSKDSRVNVEFPYWPESEYVDV